jgi:hypothetical protein
MSIRRGLGPEMAVDQHQLAVGQFPGEQRVGVANLAEQAAKRRLLDIEAADRVL